ncbi:MULTISPECIES: SSI family serine proteinase inhibitor [unclassified Streptomyces]|uniref:SSI family serine proteinase inhibitor n=1 Tax=unclassified Streptomyces TaxID=2593676 RepID=UPI002E1C9979|nr:subtilase-type protease inhibitor [Streptomyces sp. NBC_01023]
MLRRLALTAVACLSALAAAPAATAAPAGPVATAVPAATPLPAPVAQPGHRLPNPWVRDRLTITVADSGIPGADGTHRLVCAPAGGTHASPQQACDRLDQLAADRRAPFAPVPSTMMCTMQYGGPATAHITGVWRGQTVDATFRRTNGCEISRWDALEPVLPHTVG